MQKVFSSSQLKYRYRGTQSTHFEFRDFHLLAGESLLLKGASGSGKTTLLRLIEGSLDQSQSQIEINYPSVLIYQDLRLVNEASVLENVLIAVANENSQVSLTYTEAQIEKAKELLRAVGLDTQLNKLVSELSGGQKQRVAIVRALMKQPRILLADECFSQLDAQTALETYQLIRDLQGKLGFTFVASLHDSPISESHFDRTVAVHQAIRNDSTLSDRTKLSFSVLGIILALGALASLLTLDYSGFNPNSAFSELAKTLYRFLPLQTSHWQTFPWSQIGLSFLTTIKMAWLGTFLGFLIALPLAVLAVPSFSSQTLTKILRTGLIAVRAIPSLVWALLFVAAFGIGSVAGVFALTFYSVGYLGKLLYETLEDLEQKTFHTLRQLGASKIQAFRLAIFPGARASLMAHFIFMLEYNIRAASLLGLVGAGGIGQELMYALEWRQFHFAGLILMILLLLIFATDWISRKIRSQWLRDRGH